MKCAECGREFDTKREDGTVPFHSSVRYRTCPGSMKKGVTHRG